MGNREIEAASSKYKEALKGGDKKEIERWGNLLAAECHIAFIENTSPPKFRHEPD